jgi:hypothetical protein
VFTRCHFEDGYSNGSVKASIPKYGLNQHIYDNEQILALSCHGVAICGTVRKRTLGLAIPLQRIVPVDEEDDDSVDDDSVDDDYIGLVNFVASLNL